MECKLLPKFNEEDVENKILEEVIQEKEEEFDQLKKNVMQAIESKIADEEPEFLKKHPDGGFGDYLRFLAKYRYMRVGLIFAVIGAVVGLILFITEADPARFPYFMANVSNPFIMIIGFALMFFVGCLGVRWIVGYLYGAVLGFIGYPIFRAVYKHCEKKEAERLADLAALLEKRVQQCDTACEESCQSLRKASAEYVEEYKQSFQEQAEQLSQKFLSSEAVGDISTWATDLLINRIRGLNRASYVEELNTEIFVEVYGDGVACDTHTGAPFDQFYDFAEHRCDKIETQLESAGLVTAIVDTVCRMFRDQYAQDESGTAYTLTHTLVRDDEEKTESAVIRISYQARNGNFTPVKKW